MSISMYGAVILQCCQLFAHVKNVCLEIINIVRFGRESNEFAKPSGMKIARKIIILSIV